MNTKKLLVMFVLFVSTIVGAFGQTAVPASVGEAAATTPGKTNITMSLSRSGKLICAGLKPDTTVVIEESSTPALTESWSRVYAMTANTNGEVGFSVTVAYGQRLFFRAKVSPITGMSLIPAGTFTMGNPFVEDERYPLHQVTISRPFYMDKYLVTQAFFEKVTTWAEANGYEYCSYWNSRGNAADHPAQGLNLDIMIRWCNARSEMEGLTPVYYADLAKQVVLRGDYLVLVQDDSLVDWNANGYRLPTEAEWEYAARGGLSGQRFPWGNTISLDQANYTCFGSCPYDVSPVCIGRNTTTTPVGSFPANDYGLYDMAGNVYNACWDWYGPYSNDPQIDPRGPSSGSEPLGRVIRGGDWDSTPDWCQVGCRRGSSYGWQGSSETGFRCVRLEQ